MKLSSLRDATHFTTERTLPLPEVCAARAYRVDIETCSLDDLVERLLVFLDAILVHSYDQASLTMFLFLREAGLPGLGKGCHGRLGDLGSFLLSLAMVQVRDGFDVTMFRCKRDVLIGTVQSSRLVEHDLHPFLDLHLSIKGWMVVMLDQTREPNSTNEDVPLATKHGCDEVVEN